MRWWCGCSPAQGALVQGTGVTSCWCGLSQHTKASFWQTGYSAPWVSLTCTKLTVPYHTQLCPDAGRRHRQGSSALSQTGVSPDGAQERRERGSPQPLTGRLLVWFPESQLSLCDLLLFLCSAS